MPITLIFINASCAKRGSLHSLGEKRFKKTRRACGKNKKHPKGCFFLAMNTAKCNLLFTILLFQERGEELAHLAKVFFLVDGIGKAVTRALDITSK